MIKSQSQVDTEPSNWRSTQRGTYLKSQEQTPMRDHGRHPRHRADISQKYNDHKNHSWTTTSGFQAIRKGRFGQSDSDDPKTRLMTTPSGKEDWSQQDVLLNPVNS